jgi:teichuronic acid biosynthesis glycosyltransferase TuaC
MKHRLLFVSNLFPDQSQPYRGLDNVTVLHHLREHWAINVLCPRPSLVKGWLGLGGGLMSRAEDEPLQPRYIHVPYIPKMGSRFNHRLMARALRKALVGRQWDVSLGAWLYPDGCALTLAQSQPTVLIAQGTDVHSYLRDPVRESAIFEAVAASRTIITRSQSLARLLGTPKAIPIHNGVDVSLFKPGPRTPGKTLLFVGNLLPVKDPHLMLKVATLLPEWKLVMAGKGPMRAELEAAAPPNTTFLGPQDAANIALWMNTADLLCMTSHNEGLPNVVLEAMASGLPVVATDVGGISEVIDQPWKGTLCQSRDPQAIAQVIQETLARTDRQQIAAQGSQRSWQATARAYHKVLEQAMADHSATVTIQVIKKP